MWELLLRASYQTNCTTNTHNFPTSKQELNNKLGRIFLSGNSDECAWRNYPCNSVYQYRAKHHIRFNYNIMKSGKNKLRILKNVSKKDTRACVRMLFSLNMGL
jgi:hypothetical protein